MAATGPPMQFHVDLTGSRPKITTKKFTVYTLKVEYVGEATRALRRRTWTVEHRYSEFDQLRDHLEELYPAVAPIVLPKFPSKSLFSALSSSVISERQVGLNEWIKAVVAHPVLMQAEVVRVFLWDPALSSASMKLKDGRTYGYAEYGDVVGGIPLMFLHGTPGSRILGRIAHHVALGANFRIICPERPGFGLSTPSPGHRLVASVADMEELADHLGIGKFGVVGYATGGAFALAAAWKIAPRLLGCVLAGGAMLDRSYPYGNQLYAPVDNPLGGKLELMVVERLFTSDWFLRTSAGAVPDGENAVFTSPVFRRVYEEGIKEGFVRGRDPAMQEMTMLSNTWPFKLHDVVTRVHMWHGEQDSRIPPEAAMVLADQLPNCHAVFLADFSHYHAFSEHWWSEMLAVVFVPDTLAEVPPTPAVPDTPVPEVSAEQPVPTPVPEVSAEQPVPAPPAASVPATPPVLSAQPAQPAQPVLPVHSVPPVQPVQPVQAMQAVQPVQTVRPVLPVQPVQPVQPLQPVQPVQSVPPVQPVQPVESVVQPMQQHVPSEQSVPSVQPIQPMEPVVQVAQPTWASDLDPEQSESDAGTDAAVLGVANATTAKLDAGATPSLVGVVSAPEEETADIDAPAATAAGEDGAASVEPAPADSPTITAAIEIPESTAAVPETDTETGDVAVSEMVDHDAAATQTGSNELATATDTEPLTGETSGSDTPAVETGSNNPPVTEMDPDDAAATETEPAVAVPSAKDSSTTESAAETAILSHEPQDVTTTTASGDNEAGTKTSVEEPVARIETDAAAGADDVLEGSPSLPSDSKPDATSVSLADELAELGVSSP